MATKEIKNRDRELDAQTKLMVAAVGVMVERVSSLPKQDKDDLFELVKALRSAKTQEDIDAILKGITEIIEQTPSGAFRMEMPRPGDRPEKLQKWVGYISSRIRELRISHGLTQTQLAEKSGLPQSHISRLESGEHSPSHVTLEKLAIAFGIAVGELDPSA